MPKAISLFVFVFVFLTILLGLDQLAFKKYILADILELCCENEQCNNHGCDEHSRAGLVEYNCQEWMLPPDYSCYDCITDVRSNLLCDNPTGYQACNLSSGLKYSTWYGVEWPLSISILGPIELEPGQQGNFYADVNGGITPYHYQWQIYYPCLATLSSEIGIDAAPCGYWYNIGSNSPSLTISTDRDFRLKCKVTDSHAIETGYATSNTLYVTVGDVLMSKTSGSLNKEIEELGSIEIKNNLLENYPNPFNPTTMISYQLTVDDYLTLIVYDALGREVKTLVNMYKTAGKYTDVFDGSNLSSGVYFVVLKGNNFTLIHKMLLTK